MMTHKEVSYIFYTLPFYLIVLAEYMLGGKTVEYDGKCYFQTEKKRIDCSNKNNIIIWILNICKRKQK